MFNTVCFWYFWGVRNSFFFFFFFTNKKKGLTRVIIDPTHLNLLLMAWDTLGHVRTIRVVAQHFCDAHNSNPVNSKLVSVTKSKTPTNAPRPKGARNSYLFCIPWPPHMFERIVMDYRSKILMSSLYLLVYYRKHNNSPP